MPEASRRFSRWLSAAKPPEYAPKEAHPEGMPAGSPGVRRRSLCMLASRWDESALRGISAVSLRSTVGLSAVPRFRDHQSTTPRL